jgi:hypothetical protein
MLACSHWANCLSVWVVHRSYSCCQRLFQSAEFGRDVVALHAGVSSPSRRRRERARATYDSLTLKRNATSRYTARRTQYTGLVNLARRLVLEAKP